MSWILNPDRVLAIIGVGLACSLFSTTPGPPPRRVTWAHTTLQSKTIRGLITLNTLVPFTRVERGTLVGNLYQEALNLTLMTMVVLAADLVFRAFVAGYRSRQSG